MLSIVSGEERRRTMLLVGGNQGTGHGALGGFQLRALLHRENTVRWSFTDFFLPKGFLSRGVAKCAAAALLLLIFCQPMLSIAIAQQVSGVEQDPAFLEEQRQLERDLEELATQARALERELAGEDPEVSTVPEEAEVEPAAEQPVDTAQLASQIQTLLADAGCYTMRVDGKWGPGSRKAAADFATHKGIALDGQDPTPELAALLRDHHTGGRVCPLVCHARHEAKEDTCVLKTCPSGQTLNRNGQCVALRQADSCRGYRLSQKPNRQECSFLLAVSRSGDWGRADREASRRHYMCNCR